MIALASDHGGYELKEAIKAELIAQGYECKDFGTYSTESCHYPEFAAAAARSVASGECEKGIVICTTGIGVSIVANKIRGIRCALCGDVLTAEMTRRHNNSNMLAMGAGIIGKNLALKIVSVWLNTEYEGGRHDRRLEMIAELEQG